MFRMFGGGRLSVVMEDGEAMTTAELRRSTKTPNFRTRLRRIWTRNGRSVFVRQKVKIGGPVIAKDLEGLPGWSGPRPVPLPTATPKPKLPQISG